MTTDNPHEQILQLLITGGFLDPGKLKEARDIIGKCASSPSDVNVLDVLNFLLEKSDAEEIIMNDGEFYFSEDKDGDQPLQPEDIIKMFLKANPQYSTLTAPADSDPMALPEQYKTDDPIKAAVYFGWYHGLVNAHTHSFTWEEFQKSRKPPADEIEGSISEREEWINVENGLPPKGRGVITYHSSSRSQMYNYMFDGEWQKDVNGRKDDITHWINLPKPPIQ